MRFRPAIILRVRLWKLGIRSAGGTHWPPTILPTISIRFRMIPSIRRVHGQADCSRIRERWEADGCEEGPYRIVIPDEKRPARWIRQVTMLKIVDVQ